jgi:xylose isomerase
MPRTPSLWSGPWFSLGCARVPAETNKVSRSGLPPEHAALARRFYHATLAGHTMHHEHEVAAAACALGTLDANTGHEMIGWDTDQFPTSLYLTTQVMLTVLKMGGFTTGGLNFGAKVRRESFEPIDLLYSHIGGMDAFARGLKSAAAIRADGRLAEIVKNRYTSWSNGIGESIEEGKEDFVSLHHHEKERPCRSELYGVKYRQPSGRDFVSGHPFERPV